MPRGKRQAAAWIGGLPVRDWVMAAFVDPLSAGLNNESYPVGPRAGWARAFARLVEEGPDPGSHAGGALAGLRSDYAAYRQARHLGLRRHGLPCWSWVSGRGVPREAKKAGP